MTPDDRDTAADWVPAFIAMHRDRFDPHDWPAADSAKYEAMVEDWAVALAAERVTDAEARRASRRLVAKPPRYRRDHLPAILAAVRRMRADHDTRAASLDEAKRLAAACERCGGHGWVSVYDPDPNYEARRPYAVAVACVCAYGAWIRSCYDTRKHRDMLKHLLSLADVIAGKTAANGIRYQLDPPHLHAHEVGGPGAQSGWINVYESPPIYCRGAEPRP